MADLVKKHSWFRKEIATDLDLDTSANTYLGDYSDYEQISVDIIYVDADNGDGSFKLQQKNPLASTWTDVTGLSATASTVSATADSIVLQDDNFGGGDLRVAFTKGTDTTGTYDIYVNAKRRKG